MPREATGRSTKTLGVRLTLAQFEELERRSGADPMSVWAARILTRELKKRPGEGTRKAAAKARGG